MDERVRSTPPIATAARAARKTIQQIARRAVPGLADFAVVFVVAGRSIVAIASAHVSSGGERLLRSLRRAYHIRGDDLHSTVAEVVRTGRPALRRGILQENHARAPSGSLDYLHRRPVCRPAPGHPSPHAL